jgi:hypothetical protein
VSKEVLKEKDTVERRGICTHMTHTVLAGSDSSSGLGKYIDSVCNDEGGEV